MTARPRRPRPSRAARPSRPVLLFERVDATGKTYFRGPLGFARLVLIPVAGRDPRGAAFEAHLVPWQPEPDAARTAARLRRRRPRVRAPRRGVT